MTTQEKVQLVMQRLSNAAIRSGRQPEDITLIAVSKMHDINEINDVLACGIENLGENKVQELNSKYDNIDKSVNWHLIGHLQNIE